MAVGTPNELVKLDHFLPRGNCLASWHALFRRQLRRLTTGGKEERLVLKFVDAAPMGTVFALLCSISGWSLAAEARPSTTSVDPGTLVRWSVPGTKLCMMGKRSWAPLEETCYYPIDLLQKPGKIKIGRRAASGRLETAVVSVGPNNRPTEEIDLGDIPQASPSPEDLQRNAREQVLVGKVWRRKETEARFRLPLAPPVAHPPEAKTFGWKRVFNGKEASQPHMGADYAVVAGTPVLAVADGTVAFADDLFFAGKAVFIDHGDGLVTESFHLSEIKVTAGQEVARGDTIGLVGSTGRSSGPHLYFGVRWHDARIDPKFLLQDPEKIPAVGP
jgi:Peptidase family M23